MLHVRPILLFSAVVIVFTTLSSFTPKYNFVSSPVTTTEEFNGEGRAYHYNIYTIIPIKDINKVEGNIVSCTSLSSKFRDTTFFLANKQLDYLRNLISKKLKTNKLLIENQHDASSTYTKFVVVSVDSAIKASYGYYYCIYNRLIGIDTDTICREPFFELKKK